MKSATLQSLRNALSEGLEGNPLTLKEFGCLLGGAVERKPYSKSYVHALLSGNRPIIGQVERAARVLMVGLAALNERSWIDPLPTFEGAPVEQLKRARESGVSWQDLYARDAAVRAFVDALLEMISRG